MVVLTDTGLPEACLAKEEQDTAPVSPETLAAAFEGAAGRPPPAELLPFLLRVAQGEVKQGFELWFAASGGWLDAFCFANESEMSR